MAGSAVLPGAFDAVASSYDVSFSATALGRLLRPRVWSVLDRYFRAGDRLLELACGTGEDALWLARRGVRVTATDGSAAMIRIVNQKVQAASLHGEVTARHVSFQQVVAGEMDSALSPTRLDGVLSNFGGLNVLAGWRPLAEALARIVRPGGVAVLVPMGPFCPWEVGWHLAHAKPWAAIRRWGGPAEARVGDVRIPVYYPSAARLRRDFEPWFRAVRLESLGLWLPPSYLNHFVDRRPGLFRRLARFEAATARLTGGWGDHYILVLERRGETDHDR